MNAESHDRTILCPRCTIVHVLQRMCAAGGLLQSRGNWALRDENMASKITLSLTFGRDAGSMVLDDPVGPNNSWTSAPDGFLSQSKGDWTQGLAANPVVAYGQAVGTSDTLYVTRCIRPLNG